MRVRCGTSGYSYKEWKGPFYPVDLPASGMLGYYAGQLDTVEINNTFYRMPTRKLLEGWLEQVGERDFTFVLKASRRISHQKRLGDVGEELSYLLEASALLGKRRGPLLVQTPPFFKKDVERLGGFLEQLPKGLRVAFEFRNASWFDDEIYDALRARNMAWVTSDTDKLEDDAPVVATADYGYLRLRREDYDDAALERWASRVAAQSWKEAFVFFKHEDGGVAPRLAGRFGGLVAKKPGES